MQETKTKPWDLPVAKIAELVKAYRLELDISKFDFYIHAQINSKTLDKVEAGSPVDHRIIARIDRRWPKVFA